MQKCRRRLKFGIVATFRKYQIDRLPFTQKYEFSINIQKSAYENCMEKMTKGKRITGENERELTLTWLDV